MNPEPPWKKHDLSDKINKNNRKNDAEVKIGFFDSGIGGLTVLHQALKLLPDEDYIFYADTLHVPYGEKSREEVRRYIADAVDFIADQGVKAIVIACNTATSVAVKELRERYEFPILGIEPAVKPAILHCEGTPKKVLVLATPLTLKEEKYHHLVKSLDRHDIVDSLALPGLVRLAEDFEFSEERVLPYLREQLSPLHLSEYGTVVLGCTHFPYFSGLLGTMFDDDTEIISGSRGTASNLKNILEARGQLDDGTGEIAYYHSGSRVEDQALLSRYNTLYEMLDRLS